MTRRARRRPHASIILAAATLTAAICTPLAANVFAADGRDPRRFADADPADVDAHAPVGSVSADFTLRNVTTFGGVAPGEGTAFMVSPCYALTAYHVLFGGGAPTLNPMGNYPVTLRFGGDAAGHPALMVKGHVRVWGSAGRAAPDVALILLDGCPGRRIGWFDLAPAPTPTSPASAPIDTPVTMPGFAADRSMRRLSVQTDCRIRAVLPARGWLLHDCASREGASGAPLLVRRGGQRIVVGINAGEFDPRPGIEPAYTPARANWAIDAAELRTAARLVAVIARDQQRARTPNPLVPNPLAPNTLDRTPRAPPP